MYFWKVTFVCVLAVCLSIDAVAVKRKSMKTKVKKINPKVVGQQCGCKKPALLDILNYGPRGPIIEPALGPIAPIEIAIPPCQSPIIDIPNYRYADAIELNPLGCLFPSIEIPNYGLLSAPMSLPSVEYFTAIDLPCGCQAPKCGCRAPAVKLPAYPREFLAAIDVPNCGCQGLQVPASPCSYGPIASVIELPSYSPASVIQIPAGCRGPAPACGCQGPCSCPEYQILPCGCQSSCSCSGIPIASPYQEYQVLTCGCQGSCSCPAIPISSCSCQGPCACQATPISSCGCQGPCSCPEYQILSCGCQGSCSCPTIPAACGCQGPCSCPSLPVGLLPAVEAPCGCGCGTPGCNNGKYLRQVTLQPPFL